MLLGINLLLLLKVNAAKHNLQLLVNVNAVEGETVNREVQLQALVDGKKIIVTEASIRRDLQLYDEEGMDCLPNATIFEELTRMGYEKLSQKLTFYKAFFSPQRKFLIHTVLQCLSAKTTAWNEFSSNMASAIICLATNQKFNFSKYIFENMVKNLENVSGKFLILKKRVKKLEKKRGSTTHKLKRLYKVGRSARLVSSDEASLGDQEDVSKQGRKIDDIDVDVEITLVDETQGRHDDDLMFDTGVLNDEEVFAGQDMAEKEVSTADPVTTAGEVVTTANVEVSTASPTAATITNVELTLAQTLAELKSARPKTKGVVMQEPSESITTTTTIPSKDKGKGIMVEEPLKMKKKDQVLFDEQEAIRLQAQFDEEERIAREKEEANAALIAQWNDIQDKVETDYELAQRLQAEEQEELTIEEKSKLFQQLLEKRRKHFAAKRAEERRNRPPTKAQQRSIMCTYLKNMAGWKPKDLKTNKVKAEGNETREESSLKRAGDELEQEKAKKQKVDDDQEAAKMKELMKIIPDEEEVAVDDIPLATKPPSIVDYKIIKEGKISNYQIIRADGSLKSFLSSSQSNSRINEVFRSILLVIDEAFNEET
ncbi:hypothetical protein Tco_0000344 [Tanacetum coccineum]